MKSGVPPTARNARTGELTPPGITRQARSYSSSERGCRAWRATPSGMAHLSLCFSLGRCVRDLRRRRARRPQRAAFAREESIHCIGAGMGRRRAQTGQRQMRQPARHGRPKRCSTRAGCRPGRAALRREHALDFLRGDLLEGAAKLSELTAYGARCEFAAQAREPLIDGRAHRRHPHELRQAPLLRGLDEIVHADAGEYRRAGPLPDRRSAARRNR